MISKFIFVVIGILVTILHLNTTTGKKPSYRQYDNLPPEEEIVTAYLNIRDLSCPIEHSATCVPMMFCTSLISNISLMEKNYCALNNYGAMGVCCSHANYSNTPNYSPINPISSNYKPYYSSTNLINLSVARKHAIQVEVEEVQAEKSLLVEGLTAEPNSPEELHSLITFADPNVIQLAKKGLAFITTSHTLVNRSTENVTGILQFSPTSFSESPVMEACKLPDIDCSFAKCHRSYDGACNNLKNANWGKESTGYGRISYVTYADGFSAPRIAVDGSNLTSCRIISTSILNNHTHEYPYISSLFMSFGQFIDHDLSLTPTTQVIKNGQPTGIQCCPPKGQPSPHPECMPIEIPPDDYFYKTFNRQCMTFVRTLPALPATCNSLPREQMNSLTSYFDASQIYGSTEVQVLNLRSMTGGLLRIGGESVGHEFPPHFDTSRGCVGNVTNGEFCFEVGDVRSTEQPLLGVLHVVFFREHNRIARELARLNPAWDDEFLFRETRKLVIAISQKIIYNEYLPLILGDQVMRRFELELQNEGFFNKYDEKVDATLLNEFATAAFRYGHSLVQSDMQLIEENGQVHHEQLVDRFLKPFNISLLDSYIRGSTAQPSQIVDDNIVPDLTNRLFQRNGKFGLDLAAINCQRGRDHGIGTYTQFRQICGLEQVNCFDDLVKYMNPQVAAKFSKVYKNVHDIDLWVGGVMEKPIVGGMVGPVFACIIAEQFKRLRFGDRFWFENGGEEWSFTSEQLHQIRQASLARLFCDNSDVKEMQPLPMMTPSSWNIKSPCDSSAIPKLSLESWKALKT